MSRLVTVVVVTWNGAHLLPACLDALAAQTLGMDKVRTIVVDNGSSDATLELLTGYTDVDVARSATNLGFAGGATLALSRATTPYSVVLNNDARPEPDWLEHLLAGFTDEVAAVTSKVLLQPRYVLMEGEGLVRGDVHRVIVDGVDVTGSVVAHTGTDGVRLAVPAADGEAVTVRVTSGVGHDLLRVTVGPEEPRVDILNSTGGVLTPTGHGADRGYLEVDAGQYDHALDVFAVCGAAAAFRTDVAAAVGWFDPWYFAYYEDLDLSWRLRRAGWKVRYSPAARVRHEHAATSQVGSDLFLFHNRRNRLATLVRNATLRQLVSALAGRSDAVVRGGELLAAPAALAGPPPRGRPAALFSFLTHLPTLLAGRLRAAHGPDLSPAAVAARQQMSPRATGG